MLSSIIKKKERYCSAIMKHRWMTGHILFEFHCKDTGVGMSKEFQNHIFEPFTQETGGARSVYGGTGLGMPITKKLIEKMGGTIKLERNFPQLF